MFVEQLLNELAFVSPILPWAVRIIAITLIVLIAWVVLSVPAYWLERASTSSITAFLSKLRAVRERYLALSDMLFQRRHAPVEEFARTHTQVLTLADENADIVRSLEKVRRAVAAIPTRLNNIAHRIDPIRQAFERASNQIDRIPFVPETPAPTPEEFARIQAGHNRAALKASVFLFFSAVLISVNTLMLSEFFASFFPPVRLLGLKVSLIVACLFSFVEFAFGSVFAFIEGTSVQARIARITLGVLVLVLALVEFGFYARFGQQFGFNPFAEVFASDSLWGVMLQAWFGVFGPAVVLAIAWCAHSLFDGVKALNDNRVARQWRSYLRQRERLADTLHQRLVDSTGQSRALTDVLSDVETALVTMSPKSLGSELEQSRERFGEELKLAQSIRLADTKALDHSEMIRTLMSNLFLAASAVISATFIGILYSPLGIGTSIALAGIDQPSLLVAVLEAFVLIGAGYITQRVSAATPGVGTNPSAASMSRRGFRILAGILVVAVLLANAFFIFQRGTAVEAMWFGFLTAASLWLFRCGQNLGMMIAATWTFVQCAALYAISAVLFLAALTVAGLRVVLEIWRLVVAILAYPYQLMFSRNRLAASGSLEGTP